MIGTQKIMLMIKVNKIMVRVGGGFATLADHIHQVGPFECIKIYKLMKGHRCLSNHLCDIAGPCRGLLAGVPVTLGQVATCKA